MKAQKHKYNLPNSLIIMSVFVMLGIIISAQVKSVANERKYKELKLQTRITEYQNKIAEVEKELQQNKDINEKLVAKYYEEMTALYNNDKQFYDLYKKYENEITEHKFAAGLTAVTGAGIDIGVDDAQKKFDSAPALLVHDIYLNEIINTLRAAGAQAISVNGERIVSMSETLCMGPSIRINNTKLFAPYHIEAIGDPQTMLTAFRNSRIYEIMIKDNLIVDPVIKDRIRINKYSKSYESAIDLLEKYE